MHAGRLGYLFQWYVSLRRSAALRWRLAAKVVQRRLIVGTAVGTVSTSQVKKLITRLHREAGGGTFRVLNVLGIRGEESTARAKKPTLSRDSASTKTRRGPSRRGARRWPQSATASTSKSPPSPGKRDLHPVAKAEHGLDRDLWRWPRLERPHWR